jgi:hypothetical protein
MNNNERITLPRVYQETNPDTYSNGLYLSRYKVRERPTSPALLHTSSSQTPFHNDTKGRSPSTSSPPKCVVCVKEEGEVSFYSLQGWFPASLCMETLATALRKRRGYSISKCTWTGVHRGSADPGVRPTPGGASCHTRFIKNINRAIIYAPGSSHAYIQQNHQDIITHIT